MRVAFVSAPHRLLSAFPSFRYTRWRMATDASPPRESFALYPPIDPYKTAHIQVSPIHRVYYEISGNENGIPVLFVHGGPGGGTVDTHRRFFNPKAYKIILFDQRGCGKSMPTACLEENTTWHLVEDMEIIREECQVEKWVLFGGSWGSTLSLAYAQKHPSRVMGMILRGIFLGRPEELRWLYEREGAAMLYPEAFERYIQGLPQRLRNCTNLMKAYHSILSSEDHSEERSKAACAWSAWEHCLSSFPGGVEIEGGEGDLAFARIESHYFVNGGWLGEGLLKSVGKIDCKVDIIQGRWDMVCPRKSAHDLAKALGVQVTLVEAAGHSTFETGVRHALVKAADNFAIQLGANRTQLKL